MKNHISWIKYVLSTCKQQAKKAVASPSSYSNLATRSSSADCAYRDFHTNHMDVQRWYMCLLHEGNIQRHFVFARNLKRNASFFSVIDCIIHGLSHRHLSTRGTWRLLHQQMSFLSLHPPQYIFILYLRVGYIVRRVRMLPDTNNFRQHTTTFQWRAIRAPRTESHSNN